MKRCNPIQGIRQRLRVLCKTQGIVGKFSTNLVKILCEDRLLVTHSDLTFVPTVYALDGIKIVYVIKKENV